MVCLLPHQILHVDLLALVPRKSRVHGDGRVVGIPLVLEEVIGVSVAVAEEEKHGSRVGVLGTFLDEGADGRDARSCDHGDEGPLGVAGAVDGGQDRLDGDGEGRRGGQVGEVSRAQALSGLAQDGAVLDQRDEEVDASTTG